MSREAISFSAREADLRRDVSELGSLVGELLREQSGEMLFQAVEECRRLAIAQREEGEPCDLSAVVARLAPTQQSDLLRAFSAYFQVVNIAETVHRIRRLRARLRQNRDIPDGLALSLQQAARKIDTPEAMAGFLADLHIQPVFTAHPTEPTRRTLLEKRHEIARALLERVDAVLTPWETERLLAGIRAAITTAWQTEEHPSQRMAVADEMEHVLFFLTEVIYPVVPRFYDALERAVQRQFPDADPPIPIPPVLSFGSWVGGDMDGNPNVTADTVRNTLRAHRRAILGLYRSELDVLARTLSQTPDRVGMDGAMLALEARYADLFPDAVAAISHRHANMHYRRLCRLMEARIDATLSDAPNAYAGAVEFLDDLQVIERSLGRNRGRNAGLDAVRSLMWRVETFRFHLASLDLRQDSEVHRRVLGRLLERPDWEDHGPEGRARRLEEWLASGAPLPGQPGEEDASVVDVFRAVRECRKTYGPGAIGPYIISMAQSPEDVLAVLVLARAGGLADDEGNVPLDIAPLFETVPDLENSASVLETLLTNPVYRDHLARRDNRQMVMIGYSDSNKDSGLPSARWALQKAEASLVELAERFDVELTLFHGRGGTISRGGGPTHTAVQAAPKGAVGGRLRVTEQGEIINAKYGLREISLQTLERATGSVMVVTATEPGEPDPRWRDAMEVVARVSRERFRAMVYESPDFYAYFRQATPIDVIERMKIGSRPASRRKGRGIGDLRAIPWVFSWMQNRQVLPGWFGLGAGLEAARKQFGTPLLEDMFREWPFVRALLVDVEMVLAKGDMFIGERYAELAESRLMVFFEDIRDEFQATVDIILELKKAKTLLDGDPVLQRAIRLRNPYVDPLSLLQVDLLRRWRASDRRNDDLLEALLLSVNGIAHGLQNTG